MLPLVLVLLAALLSQPLALAHGSAPLQHRHHHHHALSPRSPHHQHRSSSLARRAPSTAKVVNGTGLAGQFTSANTAISSVFLLPGDGAVDGEAIQGSARVPNTWSFSIAFARSTFVSPTSSFVSYSASLASGAALPSWLSFSSYGIYFFGVAPSADGAWDVELCGGRWDGGKDVCQVFELVVDRSPRAGEVRSGSNATASATASSTASASATPTSASTALRRLNITAESTVDVRWAIEDAQGKALLPNATLALADVAVDCSSVAGLLWNATSLSFAGSVANASITDPTYPTSANASAGSRSTLFLPVTISAPSAALGNLSTATNTTTTTAAANGTTTMSLLLPLSIYPSLFTSSATADPPTVNATIGQPFALDVVRNLADDVSAGSQLALTVGFSPEEAADWLWFNRTTGVVGAFDTASAASERASDVLAAAAASGGGGARKRAVDDEGNAVVPAGLAYDSVVVTLTAEDSLTGARSHEQTTVAVSAVAAASPADGDDDGNGGGGGLSKKGRTIVGAVLGSVLGALLLLLLLFLCCRRRRQRSAAAGPDPRSARAEKAGGVDGAGGWFDPDDDDDADNDNDSARAFRPVISLPLVPPPAAAPSIKRSSTTTLARFRDFFVGGGTTNHDGGGPRDRSRMVSTHKASLSSGRAPSAVFRPQTVGPGGGAPTSARSSADDDGAGYWSAREEQLSVEPPLTPVVYAEHTRGGWGTSLRTPGSTPGQVRDTDDDDDDRHTVHGAGGGRRSSVSSVDRTPPTPGRGAPWGQRALFPFLQRAGDAADADGEDGFDEDGSGESGESAAAAAAAASAAAVVAARHAHQTHQSLASWESASTYDWNSRELPSPVHMAGGSGSDKQPSSGSSFPSQYSGANNAGALRDEQATPAGGLPFSLTQGSSLGSFDPNSSAAGHHHHPAVISRADRVPSTQAVKVRVTSTGSTPPATADSGAGPSAALLAPDVRTVRHSVPPANALAGGSAAAAPLPFSPRGPTAALHAPHPVDDNDDDGIARTYMTYLAAGDGGGSSADLHTRPRPAGDVADFGLTDDSRSATDDEHDGAGGAEDDTFGSYDGVGGGVAGLAVRRPTVTSVVSPLASLARTPSGGSGLPRPVGKAGGSSGTRRPGGRRSTAGLTPPRPLEPSTASSSGSSPTGHSAHSPKLSMRTSNDSMSLVYYAYLADPFSFRPVDDAAAAHRGGVLRAVQTGPEGKGEKALPRWLAFDRGVFEGVPGEGDEGRIELKITETGPSPESGMLEERTVGHFTLEVRPGAQMPKRSTRAGGPDRSRVVSSSGLVGQWAH